MRPQLELPGKRVWQRELPADSVLKVSPGDDVQPKTVLAEAHASGHPLLIELGQAQPLVSIGQEVQAGEIVARQKKLLGRGPEVQAPVTGKVLLVSEGLVLLQPPPVSVSIEAQLPGSVAVIRSRRGVDVEGCFGMLRGWATSGVTLHGKLGDDVAIVPEPLTTASFQALAAQALKGVVAASWAASEGPTARFAPDSPAIFLTEPMPGRPMAPPLAEALQRHVGQPVALRLGGEPLLGFASSSAAESQCFGPGAWVRAADGRAGLLTSIGDRPRFFPSGLRAVPAEVDFGDRTETVALDSLEWIA
ncbi:MAG TPA: hypothetical protein VF157_11970 [Chloroflexota bacterium]